MTHSQPRLTRLYRHVLANLFILKQFWKPSVCESFYFSKHYQT